MSQVEPASRGVTEARRRGEGLRIEVPGSSANLGPGFDALAVAVRLYLRVTVQRVLDGPRNTLQCSFAGVALEGDNYVARSVDTLARREGIDYPALDVTVEMQPERAILLLLAARIDQESAVLPPDALPRQA